MQEEIGLRLSPGNHGGAEDMRLETIEQSGQRKRKAYALRLAGGGHASRAFQFIQRVRDTGDRLQFPAKPVVELVTQILKEDGIYAVVVIVVENLRHGREAAAEKARIGLRFIDRDTLAIELLHQHFHG